MFVSSWIFCSAFAVLTSKTPAIILTLISYTYDFYECEYINPCLLVKDASFLRKMMFSSVAEYDTFLKNNLEDVTNKLYK